MVVDREVEALAIMGSDDESRVTTGCVGGKGRDKKGGTPQANGGTVRYSTVVYRRRLQYRSGCETRRGNRTWEECGDEGVQQQQVLDLVCPGAAGVIGCPRYATLVRRGGRRAQYQVIWAT